MKTLSRLHLVQYSFWDYETFNLRQGGTAFMGPNGAGKTSLADAVQIALVGGHGNHMHFNAQSVHKDRRSIRDYALGMMRSGEGDQGVLARKRDEALSYITLVFEGDNSEDCVSAGLCIHSLATERTHRVLGLYIVPGVKLKLDDHIGLLENGDKSPLDWSTFEALVRKLAKQAGRTPTLTSKPETYLDELLHSLQHKGRNIDRDKFLRSLAQSLRLKGINSVNDYLRGYLVDAQPIDKQGTLKHIKTVRALVKQIEEVKRQIVRLSDIDGRFKVVANLYRTKANAAATRLLLQLESTDNSVAKLESDVHDFEDAIQKLGEALHVIENEDALLENSYEELLLAYNSDPTSQAPENNRKLREAILSTVQERKRNIERLTLDVREAISTTAEILRAGGHESANAFQGLTKTWESQAMEGNFASLSELKETLKILESAYPIITENITNDSKNLEIATARLKAAAEKVRAAQRGMRLPHNDDVPQAMALFKNSGIESHTVASLVKVHDIKWQAAIESFLGRNRFALVVEPGKENEAVHLLRSLSRPIYDVIVVQPNHLKNDIGRDIDAVSVSALLNSENEIALAFLRKIFGKMRQVETESELGDYDRALTVDGMLSANGGTRRIRLIPSDDWALGAEVSSLEKDMLQNEVMQAIDTEKKANQQHTLSKDAEEKLRRAIKEVTIEKYNLALSALQAAQDSLKTAPDTDQFFLPEHLANLKISLSIAKSKSQEAKSKRIETAEKSAEQKIKLQNVVEDLRKAKIELDQIKIDHLEAMDNIDYDQQRALVMYDKALILAEDESPEYALKYLQNEFDSANSRLTSAESTALTEFVSFINETSINLVEERGEWRKAAHWVMNHVKKLNESTLIDYEIEANSAREAANQSFRADVAYSMREAIKRVEHDIDDLNHILKACPEFTGGEKYKFVAVPASAHKDLYDLIQSSAFVESGTAHLFESAEGVQKTLIDFLEACETGEGKANNPLEDYRLLFNFDLEIRVNDIKVDNLSERLGVGSNGEHLVPFYVIAGASLANAYRMRAGNNHDGLAIMIIDEAFHGFDAQNAYVTAQFLRSLGLQLVMAAPDADVGKLSPVLDSYYDLDRFGTEVFTEEVQIKELAKKLLESDMPICNPDLLVKAVEQLSLPA